MATQVLIIDDEQVIRDGCSRVLEREGHEVIAVPNGEEGLRVMEEEPADVVLLDLMMPGIDGFEVLHKLREGWPQTYVIIITGFATVEKAVQAMKNGAFDFLAKPFNPDYLRIVVRRAIENQRLNVEAERLREERELGLRAIMTEQSRLRTIINCMESGVLVVDRDLTVLLHNPTLIRMLQIQADPLIGKPLPDCVMDKELCRMMESAVAEGGSFSREFGEGSIGQGYLRAFCAPVRLKTGKILGSVAVFEDLSELKKIDKAKSDFVAMVSHELRAPLASIEQMAYVLRDGLTGEMSDKGRQLIDRMLARTKELLQLVKNLLDLSKIETGLMIQNMEPVNVPSLLEAAIEMIKPQSDAKGQSANLIVQQDCPSVLGDRDNLLGVFNNIIGNAVKYTPEGGRIDVRVGCDGSFLRVEVQDTGVGISMEDLPRIFDRFYRVKGKTRGITGSGLGLSVAKSIVEAHRGTIHVYSKECEGSTFTVMLPIQN